MVDNRPRPSKGERDMGLKDEPVGESSSPKCYSCEGNSGVVSSLVGGGRSVYPSDGDSENMKRAYDNGGELPMKKVNVEGCFPVVQTQRYEENSSLFASTIIFD